MVAGSSTVTSRPSTGRTVMRQRRLCPLTRSALVISPLVTVMTSFCMASFWVATSWLKLMSKLKLVSPWLPSGRLVNRAMSGCGSSSLMVTVAESVPMAATVTLLSCRVNSRSPVWTSSSWSRMGTGTVTEVAPWGMWVSPLVAV